MFLKIYQKLKHIKYQKVLKTQQPLAKTRAVLRPSSYMYLIENSTRAFYNEIGALLNSIRAFRNEIDEICGICSF